MQVVVSTVKRSNRYGQDDIVGSIVVGKLADLVVIDRDITMRPCQKHAEMAKG